MEPATASRVHYETSLPGRALVLDVSNACLGILNGVMILANMIELGQVRAGVVVGTETGRDLVEGTIDSLLNNPDVTRKDVKLAFASLTIGSGSAAIVLCDRKLSRTGKVYSFTVVMQRPPKYYRGPVPFAEGFVELPEGVRVETQFTDCDFNDLKVGMDVEMVIEILHKDDDGKEVVTYKFRPLTS